jgi:hypothetical protein
MQKWEYCLIDYKWNGNQSYAICSRYTKTGMESTRFDGKWGENNAAEMIAELGEEGWELVGHIPDNRSAQGVELVGHAPGSYPGHSLSFKRPKP